MKRGWEEKQKGAERPVIMTMLQINYVCTVRGVKTVR